MRQVINGAGDDTTLVVQNLLMQQNKLHLTELYQISTPYMTFGTNFTNPTSFLVTNYGGGLVYDQVGKFLPSVVKRDQITTQLGLSSQECKLSWSPTRATYRIPSSSSYPLLTLYQQFRLGVFDNGCVRIWRCYLPTRGDANTLGAMPLFMGRIAEVDIGADWIEINCKGYLDFTETQVPRYMIEPSNRTNQLGLINSPNAGGEAVVTATTVTGTTAQTIWFDGTLQIEDFFVGMYALLSNNSNAQIVASGNDGVHNFVFLLKPVAFNPGPGASISIIQSVPAATQAGSGSGTASELSGFPFVPRRKTKYE